MINVFQLKIIAPHISLLKWDAFLLWNRMKLASSILNAFNDKETVAGIDHAEGVDIGNDLNEPQQMEGWNQK